jgi:DNA-binding SARP family transcriptional activator
MLLHAFDLTFDGRMIRVSTGAQRVLAFLALSDRPLARTYVAGVLWPETSDKRASGSLRSAVWDLRLTGHDLVETNGRCIQLASDLHVDYRCALELAESVLDERGPCPEGSLELELFRSDLLTDWYDEWVLVERERFRQLRLHLLETLCERLVEARRFARAVEAGVAAVAGEPLRESAHRALIQAHLAERNQAEALRQLETYERLMREDLGLLPSQELRALVRPIKLPRPYGDGARPNGSRRRVPARLGNARMTAG